MPCCCAISTKSGKRAISPSSFKISQMTEAASKPASAAKSLPASVWPARTNTPPLTAANGKIWPGLTMLFALAFLATAACIVVARSAAEIPVVTPLAASIEIVKFVPNRESFFITIGGKLSCLQRASLSVKQIKPRPYLAIKLMCSALTNSAAITKSPSFSRLSSSTSITILPALMSAMISVIGLSELSGIASIPFHSIPFYDTLYIACDLVDL